MRILALDLSTNPGYAVMDFKDGVPSLVFFKSQKAICTVKNPVIEDHRLLGNARNVREQVAELVKNFAPDYIVIEQTNQGKNRTTQKQLEFIHCLVLDLLEPNINKIIYMDSSAWRSTLGMKLTKDQRNHNKKIRLKKPNYLAEIKGIMPRGKITWKHLSVFWVNKTFPQLNFKLKDNDMADAICMAMATQKILIKEINQVDIDKIFSK